MDVVDVLKLSTDWAKAEIFSAKMVGLYSLLVLLLASGFWQLGKTAMARAFIIPLIVMAILMIAVAAGLYLANKPRISQFQKEVNNDPEVFLQKEVQRTAKSQAELGMVFKVLPAIIIIAAFLIIFVPSPQSRAIGITVILLMASLMVVDSNIDARNTAYHRNLLKSKPGRS
jgi:hypothetical protein